MSGKRVKFLRKSFTEISGYTPPKAIKEYFGLNQIPRSIKVGCGKSEEVIQVSPTKKYTMTVKQPNVFRQLKKYNNASSK